MCTCYVVRVMSCFSSTCVHPPCCSLHRCSQLTKLCLRWSPFGAEAFEAALPLPPTLAAGAAYSGAGAWTVLAITLQANNLAAGLGARLTARTYINGVLYDALNGSSSSGASAVSVALSAPLVSNFSAGSLGGVAQPDAASELVGLHGDIHFMSLHRYVLPDTNLTQLHAGLLQRLGLPPMPPSAASSAPPADQSASKYCYHVQLQHMLSTAHAIYYGRTSFHWHLILIPCACRSRRPRARRYGVGAHRPALHAPTGGPVQRRPCCQLQ